MTAWPGGWYVYEEGKIQGPLTAEEAFALSPEAETGKQRLVSRKGFSQWYALKDLGEIFRLTDQMGKMAETTAQEATELLRKVTAEAPKVVAKQLAPEAAETPWLARAKAEMSASVEAPAPAPVPAPTPIPAQVERMTITRAAKLAKAESPASEAATMAAAVMAIPTLATEQAPVAEPTKIAAAPRVSMPTPVAITKKALMQEFFSVQKRLRLGKLRNPYMTGLFGLPLSFGGYWIVWFAELAREISWHAHGSKKPSLPPMILALVPLVHVFMVYRLAKSLQTMEHQNRYKGISPAVAAALSVVPPLAAIYLQRAANRHWMLHVQHTLIASAQKTPSPAPS